MEAQLHRLVDHVVDLCEGADDVDRAVRAEEEEMRAAMQAMGWAPGELPLSFAGGSMAGLQGEWPRQLGMGDGGEAEGKWAPMAGEACECLFAEDGGWYPARIEAVAEAEADAVVTVTYLGYEETRTVPRAQVRRSQEWQEEEGEGEGSSRTKRQRPSFFSADGRDEEPPPCVLAQVPRKYWMQRFRLFSQFDRGVRLDPEGWFSVTPERVAAHIAERARCDVVVDLFAGCGGNVIQFALTCHRVLAIDLDATRLCHARHNAGVYGVADRVDFVLGDALALLPALEGKVDVLFMSPPWGGPKYLDQPTPYRLDQIQVACGGVGAGGVGEGAVAAPAVGGRELFARVLAVCPNVAVLLPRNVDLRELAEVADGRPLEVEENVLNYKLKTITAYFGGGFLPQPDPDFVAKRRERQKQKRRTEVKVEGIAREEAQGPNGERKRKRRGGRKRRRREQGGGTVTVGGEGEEDE